MCSSRPLEGFRQADLRDRIRRKRRCGWGCAVGAVPKRVARVGGPGRLSPYGKRELRGEVGLEDLHSGSKKKDEEDDNCMVLKQLFADCMEDSQRTSSTVSKRERNMVVEKKQREPYKDNPIAEDSNNVKVCSIRKLQSIRLAHRFTRPQGTKKVRGLFMRQTRAL